MNRPCITCRAASSKNWVLRTRSKRFESGRNGVAVRHELLDLGALLAPNAPRSRKLTGAIFGTYAGVRECCSHFKRRVPSRLACWKFRARRKAELAAMNRTPLIAGMTEMRRFMSCLVFQLSLCQCFCWLCRYCCGTFSTIYVRAFCSTPQNGQISSTKRIEIVPFHCELSR